MINREFKHLNLNEIKEKTCWNVSAASVDSHFIYYQFSPGQQQEPPLLPVPNLTFPPKSPSQSIFHTAVSQRNIHHLTEEDSYLFIVCLPSKR